MEGGGGGGERTNVEHLGAGPHAATADHLFDQAHLRIFLGLVSLHPVPVVDVSAEKYFNSKIVILHYKSKNIESQRAART